MNTFPRKPVRVLRNLVINEVSGVDRGAGRGVKIMLMKRRQCAADQALAMAVQSICEDDTVSDKAALIRESVAQYTDYVLNKLDEEADASSERHSNKEADVETISVGKSVGLFTALASMIQKRDGCSASQALDRARREMPDAWLLAKAASAADALGMDAGGRRVTDRSASHGDSSSRHALDPHRSVTNPTTPERELARMRNEHPNKQAAKFWASVKSKMQTGLSQSQSIDRTIVESPDDWKAAMQPKDRANENAPHSSRSHPFAM
jgi:hypothetical protein